MEWIATIVILACFGVGAFYEYFTDKIDAMPEQIAEGILEKYDIKEDFSAQKKKKQLEDKKKEDVKKA